MASRLHPAALYNPIEQAHSLTTEKLALLIDRQLSEVPGPSIQSDAHPAPGGDLSEHGHCKPGDQVQDHTSRLFNTTDNDLRRVIIQIQRIASDLLTDQDIQWECAVPPDLDRIKLTTEQCLQIYLIFKEALRNIARHARCSIVCLSVSISCQRLEVKIHDNGCGLIGKLMCQSSIHRRSGGGLRNIQTRAAELGGSLEIASAFGWGTRLTLTLPIDE